MAADSDTLSRHVVIAGRVQGVWFRAWTQEKARSLGLSGWVFNRSDGRVEALFCGKAVDVERMVKACWQGSKLSKVETVTVRESEEIDSGPFMIR